MSKVLEGVRVLEVAQWWFVPSAGAVLADWGADVIKIEHPDTGDPQRGLITSGLIPAGGFNFMWEQPNRGKRSVALDLATEQGREILYKLAETSDVFLTSFLPDARQRLMIDVEHIRGRNPAIVYARGSGQGVRGPDAGKGGFDGASFWARGALGHTFTSSIAGADAPIMQRPAFGDGIGGMAIAGGIAGALYRRATTSETSIVDISLLATACWTLSPDITASPQGDLFGKMDRSKAFNPLTNNYRTKDGRWISVIMLQADRYWPDFCRHLGRPQLAEDPRFADMRSRFENRAECIRLLDEAFAEHTLEEWRERLATMEGVWAPYQTPREIHDDPQVAANGYLRDVEGGEGNRFRLAANPVQFDETPYSLDCAPAHGQHTEEILLELGMSWDEIAACKNAKVIP